MIDEILHRSLWLQTDGCVDGISDGIFFIRLLAIHTLDEKIAAATIPMMPYIHGSMLACNAGDFGCAGSLAGCPVPLGVTLDRGLDPLLDPEFDNELDPVPEPDPDPIPVSNPVPD